MLDNNEKQNCVGVPKHGIIQEKLKLVIIKIGKPGTAHIINQQKSIIVQTYTYPHHFRLEIQWDIKLSGSVKILIHYPINIHSLIAHKAIGSKGMIT